MQPDNNNLQSLTDDQLQQAFSSLSTQIKRDEIILKINQNTVEAIFNELGTREQARQARQAMKEQQPKIVLPQLKKIQLPILKKPESKEITGSFNNSGMARMPNE